MSKVVKSGNDNETEDNNFPTVSFLKEKKDQDIFNVLPSYLGNFLEGAVLASLLMFLTKIFNQQIGFYNAAYKCVSLAYLYLFTKLLFVAIVFKMATFPPR